MPKGRAALFYPLIMAAYPVVFYYAENTREAITPLEGIVALGVVLTGTLLLLLFFRLLIKDNVKVSLIGAVILVVFFSYGFVHDILTWKNNVRIAGALISEDRYLLPLWAVFGLSSVGLVLWYPGSLFRLLQAGTVVALFLVAFNTVRIGLDISGNSGQKLNEGSLPSASLKARPNTGHLPDIYYIILDAYGGADVLKEIYGFDNSEFIDSLTRMGFVVVSGSRSNYVHTEQSLAASLNMRYLTSEQDPGWLVKENDVVRTLKKLGYRYVHFGSGWAITKRDKYADIEFIGGNRLQPLLNDFSGALLKLTIATPLAEAAGLNLDSLFTGSYATRFNNTMRDLKNIPDLPGPTFTFSHNLFPHGPYIFDRDGNVRSGAKLDFINSSRQEIDLYIDQLVYVNKMVEGLVRDILKRSQVEPVIIVQGDHGPQASGDVNFNNPSDRFIFERTNILNAYYFPEHCRTGFYPNITPVNTFRVVLRSCLGVDVELLEDRTYWAPGRPPIDFDQVKR